MLAHPEPFDYGKRLSAFENSEDYFQSEEHFESDFNSYYKPTYDIPTSFMNQEPIIAENGIFERNGIPYVLDGHELFVDNGLRNYKVKSMPVIVEREKEVYLKKTSPVMTRINMMKQVNDWKKNGYEIYMDLDGQYYKYSKDGSSGSFGVKDISPTISIEMPKFEWKMGRDKATVSYKRQPLFDSGIPIGEQIIGYLLVSVICIIIANGVVKIVANMVSHLIGG